MTKKKKKKSPVSMPKKGAPVVPAPQDATHFAVPLVLFDAIRKTLGTMPWEQVSPLMNALAQCQPLSVPGGARPGATVPGLAREEG
jgi:hypothetical protein